MPHSSFNQSDNRVQGCMPGGQPHTRLSDPGLWPPSEFGPPWTVSGLDKVSIANMHKWQTALYSARDDEPHCRVKRIFKTCWKWRCTTIYCRLLVMKTIKQWDKCVNHEEAKASDSYIALLTGTKPDQPRSTIIKSGSWSARVNGAAALMNNWTRDSS